jgi:hypothetical protein
MLTHLKRYERPEHFADWADFDRRDYLHRKGKTYPWTI